MHTRLETDCFSFAHPFTLSKRYLVSDFSFLLYYAAPV